MTTEWTTPTPLEVAHAQLAVLSDIVPKCKAVFLHGSPVRDNGLDGKLLDKIISHYKEGLFQKIVLNGLTQETCKEKNLSYGGYEVSKKHLLEHEVFAEDVVVLSLSPHTGAEARNLLILAKERGWGRLAISSLPFHQLRCFLTIIAVMDEVRYYTSVYNLPGPSIPWDYPMQRLVMGGKSIHGAEDQTATANILLEGELQRISDYSKIPPVDENGKPKYTRNATIMEMLTYLNELEDRRKELKKLSLGTHVGSEY